MPSDNYIALVIGGLAVALVGVALMALYSIAAGAAMTSHLTFTETPWRKASLQNQRWLAEAVLQSAPEPTSLSDLESLFCGVARCNE